MNWWLAANSKGGPNGLDLQRLKFYGKLFLTQPENVSLDRKPSQRRNRQLANLLADRIGLTHMWPRNGRRPMMRTLVPKGCALFGTLAAVL